MSDYMVICKWGEQNRAKSVGWVGEGGVPEVVGSTVTGSHQLGLIHQEV